MQSIQIKFSSQALPAPYAQQCSIDIGLTLEKISLKISLIYIDRETLTHEEIWEEGFSGEDDFLWEGRLEEVWRNYLINAVNEKESGPSAQPGESIEVLISDGSVITNQKRWIYIMQELLQASYETAELEAPLVVRFKKIDAVNTVQHYIFTYAFRYLHLTAEVYNSGEKKLINCGWSAGADLLRVIFIPDYQSDKQQYADPVSEGIFIDPGENAWYEAKNAIKLGKKIYPIEKIENTINELLAISVKH